MATSATLVYGFRKPARRRMSAGVLPLLLASGLGGVALAAFALTAGLGWLAAVLAYALGGATLMFAAGLCAPLAEAQGDRHLQPALARARRQ